MQAPIVATEPAFDVAQHEDSPGANLSFNWTNLYVRKNKSAYAFLVHCFKYGLFQKNCFTGDGTYVQLFTGHVYTVLPAELLKIILDLALEDGNTVEPAPSSDSAALYSKAKLDTMRPDTRGMAEYPVRFACMFSQVGGTTIPQVSLCPHRTPPARRPRMPLATHAVAHPPHAHRTLAAPRGRRLTSASSATSSP